MKNILKYSILTLCSVLFVSCHGDLDVKQKDGINTGNAWESEDDAIAAMYGTVSTFRGAFMNNYVRWGEFRSNLWTEGIESKKDDINIFNNTISASHPATSWNKIYTTINSCNLILKYVPSIRFQTEKNRNKVLGNAYYIRAFCYYWVARIWGDAPLLLNGFESDHQDDLYPERSAVSLIYDQIEQDLILAQENLKEVSAPANIANYEAASTLATDFYLWKYKVLKDASALQKARAACDQVLGRKGLLPRFADVFHPENELNNEIIFAWSLVSDECVGGYASDWLVPIQYVSPVYIENPVKIGSHQQWSFIGDEYKALLSEVANDARKDVTYQTFYDDGQHATVQWINKFHGTWVNDARIFNSDIVVYRYADVLLFDAEINNAMNHKDEAIVSLNQIAQRAYNVGNYYASSLSKEQVDAAILKERLKEFVGEGKAWWDFIRFGVVFDRVSGLNGLSKSKNILLWPVNQNSLNKNPNLKQTEFDITY